MTPDPYQNSAGLGVTPMDAAEQKGEEIGVLRDHYSVDMVSHQRISQHTYLRPGQVSAEQAKIYFAVAVQEENSLTVRTPLRDVVRNSGQYASSVSRHTEEVPDTEENFARDTLYTVPL